MICAENFARFCENENHRVLYRFLSNHCLLYQIIVLFILALELICCFLNFQGLFLKNSQQKLNFF